jgi:hypothetical protein
MRRIYYSSNYFSAYKYFFRYLRILSFSYYSVIKVQLHCLTSERCHRNFQEHRSLFNTILFFQAVDTKRPGTHRRVAKRPNFLRCIFGFYVSVPFNKFFLTPTILSRTQWRWRDLNPRPSPCKGAALPLSYIPRTCLGLVGLTGFEPVTPALSAQCSNQLSYKPAVSSL